MTMYRNDPVHPVEEDALEGICVRDYIAIEMAKAIVSSGKEIHPNAKVVAQNAFELADALIEESRTGSR